MKKKKHCTAQKVQNPSDVKLLKVVTHARRVDYTNGLRNNATCVMLFDGLNPSEQGGNVREGF